jgi:prolyl 4-hydroxylase
MNRRWFNRVASVFVYLEEGKLGVREARHGFNIGCQGGRGREVGAAQGGGTKFVPRGGNALFWVNLYASGTGDERTVHAGLPLLEGRKTAMNIWLRKFYGRGGR